MAFIECWECDKKISKYAEACPHCGHSMVQYSNTENGLPLKNPLCRTCKSVLLFPTKKKCVDGLGVMVAALLILTGGPIFFGAGLCLASGDGTPAIYLGFAVGLLCFIWFLAHLCVAQMNIWRCERCESIFPRD